MTLFGVILGQYGLQKRQERQKEAEIESLRNALIAELRSADDTLRRLLYAAFDVEKAKEYAYGLSDETFEDAFETELQFRLGIYRYSADQQWFSNAVYEGNTDKIGHLDQGTAAAVVGTYNCIENLHRSLRRLADVIDHEDLVLRDDVDWSTGAGLSSDVFMYREQIKSTVARSIIFQKMALARLGDEVRDADRADVVFAYSHMDPRSEDDEEMKTFLHNAQEAFETSSSEELVEELDEVFGKD